MYADRFHDRVLKTPREVRSALAYVLHKAKKHGLRVKLGLRVERGLRAGRSPSRFAGKSVQR